MAFSSSFFAALEIVFKAIQEAAFSHSTRHFHRFGITRGALDG